MNCESKSQGEDLSIALDTAKKKKRKQQKNLKKRNVGDPRLHERKTSFVKKLRHRNVLWKPLFLGSREQKIKLIKKRNFKRRIKCSLERRLFSKRVASLIRKVKIFSSSIAENKIKILYYYLFHFYVG